MIRDAKLLRDHVPGILRAPLPPRQLARLLPSPFRRGGARRASYARAQRVTGGDNESWPAGLSGTEAEGCEATRGWLTR
jgi:hypothetical protein